MDDRIAARWQDDVEGGGDATAFPHRGARHFLLAQALALPGERSGPDVGWVEELGAGVRRYTAGALLAGTAMPDETIDVAAAAYGRNLAR